MSILADDSGNKIQVIDGVITLILKNGIHHRIGMICNHELQTIRKQKVHTLHKGNAYGFNYHVLAHARKFSKIRLTDEEGEYVFPISLVLVKGFYLHFKVQGFEKQIFLSKDIIKTHKITSNV